MTRRALTMTVLLLLAFVIVPIGGTHLHLCFDGQEPPLSLHMEDGETHHAEEQATAPHDDVDLSLVGELAAKKFDRSLDSAPPLAATLIMLLSPIGEGVWLPQQSADSVSPISVFEIRPPMRGPPV